MAANIVLETNHKFRAPYQVAPLGLQLQGQNETNWTRVH